MASVVIAGDVSGTCTLQAANAAGTTVLNLPTTSGTLVATGGDPSFTTVTTGLGNASAPSITFTGDTNTGIFSPTADTIAFTEGGVESLRINSSGNAIFAQTANLPNTFGFKNRIINGAMVIDQRNAGASVTPTTGVYTLDRWLAAAYSASSKFSVQQNAGSVTPPVGFTNYLGVTSLSAYSIVAGDFLCLTQSIEGYNIADLGFGTAQAKTICLSFWVRSSLTGTFGGALANSAGDRSYPFSYTISVANTWEQKSVTIAGDTTGTWLTTNGVGINLRIGLGVGSTYSGTAGAWAGSNFFSATGATSVVGTNGATFYLTGVQLEVGSTATSFDYRPYGTELQLCMRYYQTSYQGSAVGSATTTNAIGFWYASTSNYGNLVVYLRTTMRSQPTVTLYSPVTGASGKMDVNFTGDVNANAQYLSSNAFQAYVNNVSVAAGTNTQFHYAASIEL
jgi:hypothetical protein